MRTNIGALVTLDTLAGIPLRNHSSYTTFFVSSCSKRECTVNTVFASKCADRKVITLLSVYRFNDVLNEFRNFFNLCNLRIFCICPGSRYFNSNSTVNTSVYIYLSPVVTIVASWLLLGDPVLPMALLGAALTLVGLVLSQRRQV